jgi:ADP-heptose:LPS heptosyltransferase
MNFSGTVLQPNPLRILAICTTGIGDTLMSTPAIRALREAFPRSEIHFVVYSTRKDLLWGNPHLNRVFHYRNNIFSRILLYFKTRPYRYDYIFVFQANDDMLSFLRWFRYGICLNRQNIADPLRRILCLKNLPKHNVKKRLALVEHISGKHTEDYHYELRLRPEAIRWAQNKLQKWGIRSEDRLVGLQLGAAGAFRRWPPDLFAQVAKYLRAKYRAKILVNASPEENELVRSFAKNIGDQDFFFHGKTTIAQAAALIQTCSLFITPDTGPMHMAIALGVPLIALFVPPDPDETGPLDYPKAIVIKKERLCDPCLFRKCQDNFCVRQITAEEVCREADRILLVSAVERDAR